MPPSELGASQIPREARRKRFAYDVFLSHTSKDKPAVRELAERLKQDGLRVWFDGWVIQPGDSIPLKIEQGLEQSRTLVLVMSQNAFASEWVTLERHTTLFRDPTNAERRFIPLRLDDAEITDTLKQFAYINWRQKTQEEYARLLAACRPAVARSEPTREWQQQSPVVKVLEGHTGGVVCVAITPDGQWAVSGSYDETVRVWDLAAGQCYVILEGHTHAVVGVAVTADGQLVVSSSKDRTVRVWDLAVVQCRATLEGHTRTVGGVAVTADGQRAVSGSEDGTVRVWDLAAGQCLVTLEGHTGPVRSVAVTADGQRVVSGSEDGTVRMWDLPSIVVEASQAGEAARYTNAKVLLVGDSGVGKSGLAYRLTEDRFIATISTDGVWATQLQLPHNTEGNDIQQEIWLWDFAGQADYRLIHQLYMDETALAVLVFNPQSENPFEGLGQWDRALARAARRPFKKLLVAGRCDRGGLMVSRESIERFRRERGFAEYLETSAYTGAGCQELRETIVHSIPWTDIAWTSSPRIFKVLKDAIVKLKDEGKVLLRIAELKQQLDMRLPEEQFSLDELRAVVGLLAGPGVVRQRA